MSDFAVLRVAKITSLKGLAGASAHNTRTAPVGLDHADDHAPQMGGGIRLLGGQKDAVEAWVARAGLVGLQKPRKDAVRAVEAVMSASQEWFAQASAEDRSAWCDRSMAWATKIFGAANILQATLHDDEETPHIHILAIPLAQKERKKAGRPRKGREGRTRTVVASWGLSAADLIGSPEKLVALQTSYACEVGSLGLRRGIPRRVSGLRHRSANAYRAEAAEDRWTAACELADAESRSRGVLLFARIEAEEICDLSIQTAKETAVAFTVGLDAIEAGELVYLVEDGQQTGGLVRRKVEKPELPEDQNGWKRWQKAVQPVLICLVAYAKRLGLIKAREEELSQWSDDLACESDTMRRVAGRQAARDQARGIQAGPAEQDAASLNRFRSKRSARAI